MVLSGEALSGASPSPEPGADPDADATGLETASAQIVVVRRGYAVVVLLGLLALGIPAAVAFVRDLPARLRLFGWISLVVVAVGFAWFSVAWLTPGRRRRA